LIFDARGGLLDRIGIPDIDGQNQSSSAGLLDLAPCAVKTIKAACEQAHTRTALSEFASNSSAQTGRRAGDYHSFFFHRSIPSFVQKRISRHRFASNRHL
jgi:hypothetical protein